MKDRLAKILSRELEILEGISETRALEIDEVKKLEILTRSLKQMEEKKEEKVNPLEALTSEELVAFIRGASNDGSKAEERPKAKGGRSNSQKAGKRRFVEKR